MLADPELRVVQICKEDEGVPSAVVSMPLGSVRFC
jgi:hypothetical protein